MTGDSRHGKPATSRNALWPGVLSALAAAAILAATLTPAPPSPPLPRWCVFCGTLGGLDFLLNIALFAPLGLGLAALWRSSVRVVTAGAALSLTIELLQVSVVAGRDASVGDLLSNSIGTALGVALARYGPPLLAARAVAARRLAHAWLVLAAAVLSTSAFLLHPSQPPAPQWVQWAQPKIGFETFSGTLLAASFNGVPVHESQRLDPGSRAHPFAHDTLVLRAVVSPDQRPEGGIALITRLAGPNHEAFMLGARREAAIFRSRMRASDARLRVPVLRLPRALDSGAATTSSRTANRVQPVTLEALHARDALVLRRLEPGPPLESRLPLSVTLGWTMLLPWDATLTPRQAMLGNVLTVALLFIPLAFWSRRSLGRAPSEAPPGPGEMTGAFLPILMGGALLVVVPMLVLAPAIAPAEWSGALLGVVTGWAVGSWPSA